MQQLIFYEEEPIVPLHKKLNYNIVYSIYSFRYNPIRVERHTHHTEETKEKLRQSTLGRVWVTNGIELHQIKKEDLDKYLNNGYKLGTKYKL